MKRTCLLVCLTAIVVLIGSTCYADVSFYDGTFVDNDWQLSVLTWGNGGSATSGQLTTGGNPGACRAVTNFVNDWGSMVHAVCTNLEWTHVLATGGAIESVDCSFDVRTGSGNVGIVAIQDGLAYTGPWYTLYNNAWTTKNFSGFRADDFSLPGFDTIHPNFSSTGSPLTWGFRIANSSDSDKLGYVSTTLVDNVSITLHTNPVPEPSSMLAVIVGITGMASGMVKRRR